MSGTPLGFFAVAGQDVFLISSPLFTATRLRLAGGAVFTIEARGNGPDRPYVAAASLNGLPLERPFIRWVDLAGGGRLSLEMSDQPASSS